MNCKTCQKPVVESPNGLAHVGGGEIEQRCQNCGWTGGQPIGYEACPSCGDRTSLINGHRAN